MDPLLNAIANDYLARLKAAEANVSALEARLKDLEAQNAILKEETAKTAARNTELEQSEKALNQLMGELSDFFRRNAQKELDVLNMPALQELQSRAKTASGYCFSIMVGTLSTKSFFDNFSAAELPFDVLEKKAVISAYRLQGVDISSEKSKILKGLLAAVHSEFDVHLALQKGVELFSDNGIDYQRSGHGYFEKEEDGIWFLLKERFRSSGYFSYAIHPRD